MIQKTETQVNMPRLRQNMRALKKSILNLMHLQTKHSSGRLVSYLSKRINQMNGLVTNASHRAQQKTNTRIAKQVDRKELAQQLNVMDGESPAIQEPQTTPAPSLQKPEDKVGLV